MKRSELRTRVRNNIGRTDKDAVINDGLDFGLKEISKLYPFRELHIESDVGFNADDIGVNLPSNLKQIIELRLVDPANPTLSYPMSLVTKQEFVAKYPNVAGSPSTGRPFFCYRDKQQLFFDRKSSGSYFIRMTRLIYDKFFTDDSEPDIQDCEETLIDYSTAFTYRSIQMYDDAKNWDARTGGHLRTLVIAVERTLGNKIIGREWVRGGDVDTNVPWLDPFAGHSGFGYDSSN